MHTRLTMPLVMDRLSPPTGYPATSTGLCSSGVSLTNSRGRRPDQKLSSATVSSARSHWAGWREGEGFDRCKALAAGQSGPPRGRPKVARRPPQGHPEDAPRPPQAAAAPGLTWRAMQATVALVFLGSPGRRTYTVVALATFGAGGRGGGG
jgi:hypothetical protein